MKLLSSVHLSQFNIFNITQCFVQNFLKIPFFRSPTNCLSAKPKQQKRTEKTPVLYIVTKRVLFLPSSLTQSRKARADHTVAASRVLFPRSAGLLISTLLSSPHREIPSARLTLTRRCQVGNKRCTTRMQSASLRDDHTAVLHCGLPVVALTLPTLTRQQFSPLLTATTVEKIPPKLHPRA